MPEAAWRTVRVFISSTFRDMQAERDHLVRFVFPRLREELLKRRIHLVDVDLRWGITSEQDALEVCRKIIDECRPRFLCMLGGRYGWVPPGKEHSITADEVRYGVLDRLGEREYRFFYFRSEESTNAVPEEAAHAGGYVEADPANARKLADLKQAIRDAGCQPFEYHAQWDNASQRLVGLKEFGDRVYADLLASIHEDFGAEPLGTLDEFAEEAAAIKAFIEERTERYIVGSRQTVFDDLTRFAQADGEPNIVALTGPSGCGKSALLGKFSQDYANQHPSETMITHFVGASAGSMGLRRTLRGLCHALARAAGDERGIPQEVKELAPRLEELLGLASQRQRILLILDGLNQLDATDNAHSMYWLPRNLPANVRVIVSSLEHPTLEALQRRRTAVHTVPLEQLEEEDSRLIIEAFLDRYHKHMSDGQIGALVRKPEYGNPLYLLIAFKELRTLDVSERVSRGLSQDEAVGEAIGELPDSVRELFLWVLGRLARDDGFRDAQRHQIGADLVHQFVSCLGVSRHGLSQMELAELIAPGDPNADPPISADAQGNVAALIRLLHPYLMHRGELLNFYHTQLREAVEGKYLNKEHERRTTHRRLAEYLRRKADPAGNSTWTGDRRHGLSELPYHQTKGEMWVELEATLTDLLFVEAKSLAAMVHDLSSDYALAEYDWPGQEDVRTEEDARQSRAERYMDELVTHSRDPDNVPLPEPPPLVEIKTDWAGRFPTRNLTPVERLQAWSDFVRSHLKPLSEGRPPAFQLALNSADCGPITDAAEALLERNHEDGKPWLQLANRPPYSGRPSCLAVLHGHMGRVRGVSISPAGDRALSRAEDGTLRTWDLQTGECLSILEERKDWGRALYLFPDARRMILENSVGRGKQDLLLWDLTLGRSLARLSSRGCPMSEGRLTLDGTKVVSIEGRAVKLWDLVSGRCLRCPKGASERGNCCLRYTRRSVSSLRR